MPELRVTIEDTRTGNDLTVYVELDEEDARILREWEEAGNHDWADDKMAHLASEQILTTYKVMA